MRFILNFILFGVLFYAIYLAFPDAFFKMVGWAQSIYEFLRDIFLQMSDKFQEWRGRRGESPPPTQAWFLISLWLIPALKLGKKVI
jgi:hypothetical protein